MAANRARTVAGLLLAAGAGTRMGGPKALVTGPDGQTWVARTARTLAAGGCDPVLVVVGARADDVSAAVAGLSVTVVHAQRWQDGMGTSLRAGLECVALVRPRPEAVLVALVDTPGLTSCAVARMTELAGPATLLRASYDGVGGHPVVLGEEHWEGVLAGITGDAGASGYLRAHHVLRVECGDVADGRDVDTPADLPPGSALDGTASGQG
jgi:nicotine blue oxidoreductase